MSTGSSPGTNAAHHRHGKDDLWLSAYRQLKHDPDGNKLLAKFQKVVQADLKQSGVPIGRLNSTEGRLNLLKLINVKAQAIGKQSGATDTAMKLMLKTKDVVSAGAAASPPATIAVAGLFMAVTMQQQYFQEAKAMRDCADCIGTIIRRRAVEHGEIRSSINETDSLKDLREQLRFSYRDLYRKILSTIAKLVYKLDSRLRQLFDNFLGLTDWVNEKEGLDNAERECRLNLESIANYKSNPALQPSPYSIKGRNLLHQNAANGIESQVSTLLQTNSFDVNALDGRKCTALSLAAQNGHLKCCTVLLSAKGIQKNSKNKDGRTALHLASLKDRVEIISLLIRKGADLNLKDKDGRTALHLAAEDGRVNAVRALIKAKNVEIDALDSEGRTALHLATLKKKNVAVEALAPKVKNIDTKDVNKRTAFLDAAEVGSVELLQILQKHGSDINQTTSNHKWTCLHICAAAGRLKCVEALTAFPDVNINLRNGDGRTPLHMSVWYSKLFVARFLCEKGAEIDVRDNKQRTAFLDAARAGRLAIVKRLKEKGADINQVTGRNGWSALHEAINADKIDIVKYLIENGIDQSLKIKGGTKSGMTAKDLARSCEKPEIENLL